MKSGKNKILKIDLIINPFYPLLDYLGALRVHMPSHDYLHCYG